MSKRKVWFGVLGITAVTCWIVSGLGTGHIFLSAWAQNGRKPAERTPLVLDRAPAREIADPNPVFSGIAMDSQREEVFITNDNEPSGVSVAVYPSKFTPTESVMEPRRRIAGPQAHLGLPCGVAISPENREMYTVTGDGQNLNVFALDANGDVPPSRELTVPHASGGVSLDAKHDELYITTEHVNKVSVYRRTAQGDEAPIRYIQGPNTGLADPYSVYVDNDTNEVYVSNHGNWRRTEPGEGYAQFGDGPLAQVRGSQSHPGIVEPLAPSTGKFLSPSITIYPRTAQGNIVPLRTIQGPKTRMDVPLGVYRDPVTGELAVANGDDSVLFFAANANGDVAPIRILKGPKTNLKSPTGLLIDTKNNELWVTSWENHTTNVFPRTAQGDVAPLRVIRSAPKGATLATLGRPSGLAYDPKRDQILSPN